MMNQSSSVTLQLPSVAGPSLPRYRTHRRVGARVGLLVFLTVALLPSLLYGGVAGGQLAASIFQAPGAPSFGVGALVLLGMASAVAAGAALFAALGALAGTSVGALGRANEVRKALEVALA